MNTMRILFSSYTTAFQNPGGGEQVILALRNELTAQGHQIDYFNPWSINENSLSGYDAIHYFSCLEMTHWRFFKKHAPYVPLIVTPTLFQERGVLNRLSLLRRRLVQQVIGEGSPYKIPDHWLPTTRRELDLLHSYFGVRRDQTTVIPNGVDLRFSKSDGNLFLSKIGTKDRIILHVGRFHPVKNQKILIRSARNISATVVFIGSPDPGHEDYYEQCKQDARLPGSTKYVFLPRCSHDDPLLASAFAAATVFALPSEFETFGIAALEAAVAGCRLVLTKNLESRELFEPIASLISPNDDDEWKKNLDRALSMGRSDRQTELVTKYSWDTISRNCLAAYQKAIKSVKETEHN